MNADEPLSHEPAPAQHARALHVLVVEDVDVNRELLSQLLQHYGHVAHEAGDGVEGCERVAAGGIDLVLMDVEIPGINGLEATRRIRALPGVRGRMPVWVVSGHAFPDDIDAARAAGANGHLSKPIMFEALRDVLHQVQQQAQALE